MVATIWSLQDTALCPCRGTQCFRHRWRRNSHTKYSWSLTNSKLLLHAIWSSWLPGKVTFGMLLYLIETHAPSFYIMAQLHTLPAYLSYVEYWPGMCSNGPVDDDGDCLQLMEVFSPLRYCLDYFTVFVEDPRRKLLPAALGQRLLKNYYRISAMNDKQSRVFPTLNRDPSG